MVQLRILTGRHAGSTFLSKEFPILIGRSSIANVRLEESGVWDQHAEISLDPLAGLLLRSCADALVRVNGNSVVEARLRNGDIIELGGATVQFWLAETAQKSLRLREWFTWAALSVISVAQIWLIYRLL
jgi:pSer/pThr/pTyr-binding forkhead associated (FHA) protein